jgi:hypothetical protein
MRLALVALLVALPRVAEAQLCHLGPLDVDSSGEHAHHTQHHVEATLTFDAATLEHGAYQGVVPSLGWHHGRVGAYVAVPGYRVEHDVGFDAVGLADLTLQAHARVAEAGPWRGGLVLAASLPTGDADDGLGMGHLMLMPGVWNSVSAGRWSALATVVVGKAAGGDDEHRHMHTVTVNPMNPFEVSGTARVAAALARTVEVHGLATVAEPIGEGTRRAAVGGGATYRTHQWDLGAELQLGVAGDPFTARALVALGHRF